MNFTKHLLTSIRAVLIATLMSVFCQFVLASGTVTFDDASSLDQFSLNGNASTDFTYNPTAGVGGGGGVTSTSSNFNTASAIYLLGSANTIGSDYFVSLDYQMRFQNNGPDLRVGFTTAVNGTFDGTNDIWVETYGNTSPKFFRLLADGFPGNSTNFPAVAMTSGDWYRIRLDLSRTSASGYDVAVTLFGLGNDGLSMPGLLSTNFFSFSSPALGSAGQLYAGFFLFSETFAADNFSASQVPEAPFTTGVKTQARRYR